MGLDAALANRMSKSAGRVVGTGCLSRISLPLPLRLARCDLRFPKGAPLGVKCSAALPWLEQEFTQARSEPGPQNRLPSGTDQHGSRVSAPGVLVLAVRAAVGT